MTMYCLFVVLLSGLMCGCEGTETESQAIQKLEELGAIIERDKQQQVTGVVFEATAATDKAVQLCTRISNLQGLLLIGAELTEDGYRLIWSIQTLRHLGIQSDKEVTDDSMRGLGQLSELRSLSLHGTSISDATLSTIGTLTELETLSLNETAITDAGIRHLHKLFKLKSLALMSTQVTGGDLGAFAKAAELKNLFLDNSKVNDEGLLDIGKLASVRDLRLRGTRITDAGLSHLTSLLELKGLFITDTQTTPAGIEAFRKQHKAAWHKALADGKLDRNQHKEHLLKIIK